MLSDVATADHTDIAVHDDVGEDTNKNGLDHNGGTNQQVTVNVASCRIVEYCSCPWPSKQGHCIGLLILVVFVDSIQHKPARKNWT